jgi:hypothetical protein
MRNSSIASHHVCVIGTTIGFNHVRVVHLGHDDIGTVAQIIGSKIGRTGSGTKDLRSGSTRINFRGLFPGIFNHGVVDLQVFFLEECIGFHNGVLVVIDHSDTGKIPLGPRFNEGNSRSLLTTKEASGYFELVGSCYSCV